MQMKWENHKNTILQPPNEITYLDNNHQWTELLDEMLCGAFTMQGEKGGPFLNPQSTLIMKCYKYEVNRDSKRSIFAKKLN